MDNQNANLPVNIAEENIDFDALEKNLQDSLELDLKDLEELEEQRKKLGNPDALGDVLFNTVWEQFQNQIGVKAGEDFIKDNNNLTLDLRDEAHIQTTDSFILGNIATHNTEIDYQKRYDDWQDNFQRDEDGIIKFKTDHRTGREKPVLKKSAREPYDKGRPMGSKTIHKDHTKPAADYIRSAEANAHNTLEERVATANSENNLVDLDAAANQSKGDSTVSEWLASERDGKKTEERFDIDPEKLREREKIANKDFKKMVKRGKARSKAAGRRSQRAEATRIRDATLKAVALNLLKDLVKDVALKFVVWLKNTGKSLRSLYESIKEAIVTFVKDLKNNVSNVADTTVTTIATAIYGPVINTLKRVWMLLKQAWNTIKEVINYIRNPQNQIQPASIMMLEIGKIVVTGLGVAGSILLAEPIEKALLASPLAPLFAVEIPLFGQLATLTGILMGAIVSGVIGALAIHLINKLIAKRLERTAREAVIDKKNEIISKQVVLDAVQKQKIENKGNKVTEEILERRRRLHEETKNTLERMKENWSSLASNEEKYNNTNQVLETTGSDLSDLDIMLKKLDDIVDDANFRSSIK